MCFDDATKKKLYDCAMKLKTMSYNGNFTRFENFHLTLNFIGETNRVSDIKGVMDTLVFDSFSLRINKFGCFKRDSGDIYWLGAQDNKTLNSLYQQLNEGLSKKGFKTENRAFKPHLTLGREVNLKESFDRKIFSEIDFTSSVIKSVFLMKSERVNGKLVYTPIYEKCSESFNNY